MNPTNNHHFEPDSPAPNLSPGQVKPPPSPPFHPFSPTSTAQRRIAIAVDLSDESAYAVKWAVRNYLRPGDAVILLHVRPTSVLYGCDWGATATTDGPSSPAKQKKLEEDFDNFTTTKAAHLSQPLVDADVPFKIHIVKDHDLKERLCLEVERLGLSAMIMGSRGFETASRRSSSKLGRLGSVSDYCVRHCVCPVVVVRDDHDGGDDGGATAAKTAVDEVYLHPVPEEEQEYYDAHEEDQK